MGALCCCCGSPESETRVRKQPGVASYPTNANGSVNYAPFAPPAPVNPGQVAPQNQKPPSPPGFVHSTALAQPAQPIKQQTFQAAPQQAPQMYQQPAPVYAPPGYAYSQPYAAYPLPPGYGPAYGGAPYFAAPAGPMMAMEFGPDGVHPEMIMPIGGGRYGGPMMAMEFGPDGVHPEMIMPLF